jgi:hypothetical protein
MLEIKANKSIYFDGELLNIGNNSMKDFLTSSLNCPVVIDSELALGDLVHVLYDIRDFINLYCCEEYEVGRVLITSGKLAEGKDYLRIFKNAEITDEGFLKINIQSEMCSYEEIGKCQNLSNLKIILDSKIVDGDEILREGIDIKANFTLLEIIEVLYEDLLYSLRKDNLLI